MPIYRTSIVNREFSVCSDEEQPDQETALMKAIKGALEIGSEEVCNGLAFFGAEVTLEKAGVTIARRMVAVGATPLQ
jgi:hypothetical protein